MVGITYRSASARPGFSVNKSAPPPPQTQESQQSAARGPAPSFKDKETYQELFKPLPKPEPIPVFTQFKVSLAMFCIKLSIIGYIRRSQNLGDNSKRKEKR